MELWVINLILQRKKEYEQPDHWILYYTPSHVKDVKHLHGYSGDRALARQRSTIAKQIW